jgi:hypothetical protein
MRAPALVASLLVSIGACAPAPAVELDDATQLAVRSAVEASFDTLSKAIVAHEWDRVESLLADGDDVALAMDGQVVLGRAAILAGFRADSSILRYLDYRWENTRVRVLGPTAAIHATGFWERLAMRSGDTVEIRGTFTNGFQKVNGRWQVVHMAASHAPATP